MQALLHSGRIKVVHLSSAHPADDARIFWKECLSLADSGYEVSLVVPEAQPTRRKSHSVEIIPVKRRSGRRGRMLMSTLAVAGVGLRRNAKVYHFHDPELIPIGLALRLLAKRVIYDVHEDLPRIILFKDWIPRRLRHPVSRLAAALEWIAGHTLSGVVAATPTIARRFPDGRTALVQNFARPCEFAVDAELPRGDRRAVAYVGGLTRERCAVEMVEAIAKVERYPDIRLLIAGDMDPPALAERLAASKGWPRVDYRGRLSREGVRRLLAEARVGLAVFHPIPMFIESQPVKIYEYMAAGLPVIAADFPRFREIVEENGCGICVPSRDPAAIAAAIEWIFEHPSEVLRPHSCKALTAAGDGAVCPHMPSPMYSREILVRDMPNVTSWHNINHEAGQAPRLNSPI
jgi:glycosyltransferase involved in cell wall biosynthesis